MATQQMVTKRDTSAETRALSIEQHNAIDTLVTGKSDQATANAVGVNRVTVLKWRLHDPLFQAELNRRRADLWGTAAERLRALLPKALDVLANQLDDQDHGLQAAIAVVRLAGLEKIGAPKGETDADVIIDTLAREHELAGADTHTRFMAEMRGDKPLESSRQAVLAEIDRRLMADGGT